MHAHDYLPSRPIVVDEGWGKPGYIVDRIELTIMVDDAVALIAYHDDQDDMNEEIVGVRLGKYRVMSAMFDIMVLGIHENSREFIVPAIMTVAPTHMVINDRVKIRFEIDGVDKVVSIGWLFPSVYPETPDFQWDVKTTTTRFWLVNDWYMDRHGMGKHRIKENLLRREFTLVEDGMFKPAKMVIG